MKAEKRVKWIFGFDGRKVKGKVKLSNRIQIPNELVTITCAQTTLKKRGIRLFSRPTYSYGLNSTADWGISNFPRKENCTFLVSMLINMNRILYISIDCQSL